MATKPQLKKQSLVKQDLEFTWKGTDKRGVKVKGELRGRDANFVRAELRRQGINPSTIKKKSKPISLGEKITPKDIMLFTRQICTMLQSGIAIVQALDMVGFSVKNQKLKELILTVKADIEGGNRFADALGKHHLYFDDLYCSLVRAGEDAGVLEKLLFRIAAYLEKAEMLKSKVKKAMTYPVIVLVAAFIVTSIIMIFVIPTFEELFKGFGADLPAFTKMVISASKWFQSYWWMVFGGAFGGFWTFNQARRRSRAFAQFLDRFILKMPLFGAIAALSANARFARTLSTMFAAGVPLVDAMKSVAGATGNIVYETAVLEMRESVSIGQQLNFAMRQTGLFPDLVIQMVAIGEEAGSLGDMLSKVADFYEEELDATISSLMTLIEPMLMGFLGVLIGGLIVAMYLPIFKLAAAV